MYDLIDREKVTVFGTSAKYIEASQNEHLKPTESHDLSPLRLLLTTGSPLSEDSFDTVYREIKPDLQLSSISGGTDIVSCFALGCPTLPVYRGELQCRGLGMAVEAWDDEGNSLIGQAGELV